MTHPYTPAQLEAWAGLGPFLDCEDEYLNKCVYPRQEEEAAGIELLLAAPDLARLVLEKDAEIARLRSEVRLCHMQVESAYKELGRATAKVKAWEEIVCLDPSSDPFKVVMSDDWVEQEHVKVQIPSVQKITALLDELAAARQAMKETSDDL